MKISAHSIVKVCLAFVAFLIVVTLALNQIATSKLQASNRDLRATVGEAVHLGAENKQVASLSQLNEKARKLHEANRDLPKLRNEIRLLRERTKEWKSIHAENNRLKTVKGNSNAPGSAPLTLPDFLVKDALHDAGLGTPENAVQTFFWAMSHGNVSRLFECSNRRRAIGIDPNGVPFRYTGEITPEEAEKIRKEIAKETKDFSAFRITEKETISADEVEVALQSAVGGVLMKMKVKRIGGEWKVQQ